MVEVGPRALQQLGDEATAEELSVPGASCLLSFALEGLRHLMYTHQLVRSRLNPKLAIAGILMTQFDARTTLSWDVLESVRRSYPNDILQTLIPRNVRISEAPSHGLPALIYDLKCPGSEAYIRLAKEIIGRLPQLTAAEAA